MAVRKISMRLAIDGEQEYRAALTKINAELRKMDSALKLVQAEYKNNANSMAALEAKQKALVKAQEVHTRKVEAAERGLRNANTALNKHREVYEKVAAEYEKARAASEKLGQATEENAEEHKKLTDETARLKQEMDDAQSKVEAAERGVTRWETEVIKAKVALVNTNQELDDNGKYLDEAKRSTDGCATSIDQYGRKVKQAGDASEKAGKQGKEFGEKTEEAVDALAAALAAAGITASLNKIKEALYACIRASAEYESALAGVQKTTNLSEKELSEMSDAFKAMALEIPLATNELVGIAETAGQLGIDGKDNLLIFTEVMAKLGTATNMTSEEAATMLAQFANVTGLPVDQYENLGSAITALGNSSATTESKIVEMSQGIAATSTLAGMSSADMMALSAAVTSLGIETAAGATSMSKLISMIDTAVKTGNGLTKWASVAGLSAEEFATRWRDDAAMALATFIEGLSQVEERGGVMASTLQDLGINEVRLTRMTSSLAESHDLLSDSINTARVAFEQNTALSAEAAVRYETTESKMQLFKNAAEGLKVEIGDQLNPAFENLLSTGTDVNVWATDFLSKNEALVPIITTLITVVGSLAAGLTLYTVATKVATAVTEAFHAATATASGGITLVLSALVGLTAAVIALRPEVDETTKKLNEISESAERAGDRIAEVNDQYEDGISNAEAAAETARYYVDRLAELEKQGELTAAQQREYSAIVAALADIYPELNLQVDEYTGLLKGGADALYEYIEAEKERAVFDALLERRGELIEDYGEQIANVIEANKEREEAEKALHDVDLERAALTEQLNALDAERLQLREENQYLQDHEIEGMTALNEKYEETRLALLGLNGEQMAAQELMDSSTEAAETAQAAADLINESITDATESVELYTGATNASAEAMGEYGEVSDEFAEHANQINGQVAELEAKFAELKDEIFASVQGSIKSFEDLQGGFQKLREDNTYTVDGMLDTWRGQQEFYDNYSHNLAYLAEKNISGEMLDHFRDGSTESAAQIQALVDELEGFSGSEEEVAEKTKEFVDDFNAEYERTKEAGEQFAEVSASNDQEFRRMAESIDNEIGRLIDNMDRSSEAAAAGGNTAQGYLNGLASRLDDMYAMGVQLAAAVNEGYNRTLDQHSPSRKAMRAARDTVEGYIIGYDQRVKDMERAGAELAGAMTGGYAIQVEHVERERARGVELINHADHRRYDRNSVVNIPVTIYAEGRFDKAQADELARYIGRKFRDEIPEVVM